MNRKQLKAVVEGLLYAAGDEGLSAAELAQVLEVAPEEAQALVEEMAAEWRQAERGLRIVRAAGGYRLTTLPEHAPNLAKLVDLPASSQLSQAALETLAIIAYRQPITRGEVEDIRGVKSEKAIQTLLSKGLIEEVGRAEGPGRPILYGTTKAFLAYFGLNDLSDLPPLPEAEATTADGEVPDRPAAVAKRSE